MFDSVWDSAATSPLVFEVKLKVCPMSWEITPVMSFSQQLPSPWSTQPRL